MARRPTPTKKKKTAKRSGTAKRNPKKTGGLRRLMLGGAIFAGALSAVIATGSLLELDRASRQTVATLASTGPVQVTPREQPSREYDFSNGTGRENRTGYMVGRPTPRKDSQAVESQAQTAAIPGDLPPSVAPVPDVMSGSEDLPWRKYAALTPQTGPAPVIAIVIDDAGLDQARTARTLDLPGQVTISYLPYARDLQRQVNDARAKGHEVMLHMPMEPSSAFVDPGPHVLKTEYDRVAILSEISWMLEQFDGYVGINNHMGSKFTSDPAGMQVLMDVLKSRGLLFLDSKTSAKSVGYGLARENSIPALERDVFIDDADDAEKIADMLQRIERIASKQGYAIAIGHPRDLTLDALQRWIPEMQAKGFVFVPATNILRRNGVNATG
ncbi:MAG: divergent polysaccharide deacetylase family protein [Pseudomonadota bacterium]